MGGVHEDTRLVKRVRGDPDTAVVLLHGRGSSADDIISLGESIASDALLLAPQASDRQWYPESFLAARDENQPWLDAALDRVAQTLDEAGRRGFPRRDCAIIGFSQGACLGLEYAARRPERYSAVAGLSGGLIGDTVDADQYTGDLAGTPVFIGCSDSDPYVPVDRVHVSGEIFQDLDADIDVRIYPGMGHTVNDEERTVLRSLLE